MKEYMGEDFISEKHDELTGLLQMADFYSEAEERQKTLREQGKSPAVLFIDFSGMRLYNHKYGFEEGNSLLKSFAEFLQSFFSQGVCSRFGQDHFAVLTEDEDLEKRLNLFLEDCKVINNGQNLPVRIGVFLCGEKHVELNYACDRARFACNTFQNTFVSGYSFYDSEQESLEEKQRHVIKHLDTALEEEWVKIFYQPIIRSTNGKVCDEEALSRWDDPVYGLLMPSEFIPALEEAGLIYKLDLYVVEHVLDKIKKMEAAGHNCIPQSVNLSRADFESCDIVEEICRRVDEAGVGRDLITIELTETIVGRDFDFMKQQIERFRSLGFSVWMDDFGSGYSTLDLLQSIKFDLIKFDMRFLQDFETGENGKVILTELMKMAIGLGIDTVCEGVETEEEVQFLREIGCEKLQGYYYHKPIPAEEILQQLDNGYNIGAETKEESIYYNAIGRINLYDLAIVSNKDEGGFRQYFNMVPMAILEIDGDMVEFVRTNKAYREFVHHTVGFEISGDNYRFSSQDRNYQTTFLRLVLQCSRSKTRSFVSEKMPDKTTVHSFIRWIADNPITGASAVAVVVLAIVDSEQETTYESIARALAADYFNLYYVDLETGNFIEYSSDVGLEELAIERHGSDFFDFVRKDAPKKIYEEDIENFFFSFTKQNILRALKTQGTFTLTYRQMIDDKPVHVNMKVMRMQRDEQKIIIGVNRIDDQARLKEGYERTVLSDAIGKTEASWVSTASLNTVSFAVKSCIRLMETGDFKGHVREVLVDVLNAAQSDAARILLVDKKKETFSVFVDVNREGAFKNRDAQIAALKYEMIASWENLVDDNNAIIIEDENDLRMLDEKCPAWAQTMRRDGSENLVLVPLRRSDRILGYLYVVNYNTKKTAKIKELIELVSFFLSSEIESYLFKKELEVLSNYDELTGLKNRHAMISRNHELEQRKENCSFGIITMDLNGLKRMNDTEGHFAGDEMIRRTVDMLRREFGTEELYRIGGDEFIVIFPGITKEAFEERVEQFRKGGLSEPGISLSIGPYWSETNDDVEKAFYFADQNMYADKKLFYEKHPELKK